MYAVIKSTEYSNIDENDILLITASKKEAYEKYENTSISDLYEQCITADCIDIYEYDKKTGKARILASK